MKLLIISHTEHYQDEKGDISGWGPTVREINFLSSRFDEVYHCAPIHKGSPPSSSLQYVSGNIHFVPLKPSGGRSLKEKLSVLIKAPSNLRIINKIFSKVDVFQFRAPAGIGVYVIPYLILFVRKKGWFKYAGNWVQENPPLSYAFQRYLLKRQTKRKVTINGSWPGQPEHCLTFENPCLNETELSEGKKVIEHKDYTGKLDLCFVGRLETAKGVGRILKVLRSIGKHPRIGKVHLVGDGKERAEFEKSAAEIPLNIIFHGYLTRTDVAEIMKKSHVFLLPSDSEGFPKVLAEAANYGCLPVVSNVSSIGQYINDGQNGFLVDVNRNMENSIKNKILNIFELTDMKQMVWNCYNIAGLFTFERYTKRIFNDILSR